MKSDFYRLRKQIWRLIRGQREETNELISTSTLMAKDLSEIPERPHQTENTDSQTEPNTPEIMDNHETLLEQKM